eukprot:6724853-Alexandrium_andersonii.AAC.1
MSASLVGSEMCIRDSSWPRRGGQRWPGAVCSSARTSGSACRSSPPPRDCLLYTSDAADDM